MANFNFIIVFYSIRVASLMVVKSTAFLVPPKCQSYNILYRINILIGLTLINMFIKTKQISSYSVRIVYENSFNFVHSFLSKILPRVCTKSESLKDSEGNFLSISRAFLIRSLGARTMVSQIK